MELGLAIVEAKEPLEVDRESKFTSSCQLSFESGIQSMKLNKERRPGREIQHLSPSISPKNMLKVLLLFSMFEDFLVILLLIVKFVEKFLCTRGFGKIEKLFFFFFPFFSLFPLSSSSPHQICSSS